MYRSLKLSLLRFTVITFDKLKNIITLFIPKSILRYIKKNAIHKVVTQELKNREPYEPGIYPDGLNIIGHLSADTGLGQAVRLYARAMKNSDIPVTLFNFKVGTTSAHTDDEFISDFSNKLLYNVNFIHVNPAQLDLLVLTMKRDLWNRRYNIGYWVWELEDFPDEWVVFFDLVDEIWTPSNFSSQSIRKKTDKIVRTVPHGMNLTASTEYEYSKDFFGIRENAFAFLAMFDSNSSMERKNPMAAIKAFQKTFEPNDQSVQLIVKISNAAKDHLEYIEQIIADYENINILDRNLKRNEVNELLMHIDVFVSLHRSEGFGLVIAESMCLDKPVIATNWSGNTDFMNEENSCLVDYTMIEVDDFIMLDKSKSPKWADANIDTASAYMRRLFEDNDYYEKISREAKHYVTEHLSQNRICEIISGILYDNNLIKRKK